MKPHSLIWHILASALLLFSTPAFAIFKCNVNGKVVYTDIACAEGEAVHVDQLPAGEARRAKNRSARQKKLLKKVEREHRRNETAAHRAMTRSARAHEAALKKCRSLGRRERWAREDAASATGKSVEKARRRARRATELYDEECRRQNGLL